MGLGQYFPLLPPNSSSSLLTQSPQSFSFSHPELTTIPLTHFTSSKPPSLSLSLPLISRVRVLGAVQSAMAVSSSLAASFTGAKLETPPFLNSVSSSRSSSQYRIFCKPARTRRSLIQRGASLNSRCEVASDALVDTDSTRSSSVSALEQLKTSAADSEFSFPFSFLFLYFWKLICAFGCFSSFFF